MSIDLKKIKSKLSSLTNKGSGDSNVKWFKPEIGEQVIRILPMADGDPFKSFQFHYGVGDNPGFLCPKRNFGDSCPVCEFATKLYKEGTDESIKMAKNFFAKERFYSPIIVRGQEDEGVQIWGYGRTAYEKLLRMVLDPEFGDITDVEKGTDLTLTLTKVPGKKYPNSDIAGKRKTSPVCPDINSDECKELLDSIPDFTKLFSRKSTEDVQQILDEYMATPADEEAPESVAETVKYGSADENKDEKKSPAKRKTKVTEALEDLNRE